MSIWRPPKRTNKKAWRQVDQGDIWWDTHAIERASTRRNRRQRLFFDARHRAISRWKEDCNQGIIGCQIPVDVMYERLYGFKIPNKGFNRGYNDHYPGLS